jgi:TetR/AcrR family transcriptional regulator, transcriptional repressor for nem operon
MLYSFYETFPVIARILILKYRSVYLYLMRNPEVTKQLIVEKAISLFNTQGYRATSLSDITKAAGITKGAIYGNFKNKDEVAEASFEYAIEVVMQEMKERISAAPTAPLKLKAIVNYHEEYIKSPPFSGGCPIINTSVEADDNYPQLRSKAIRSVGIMKTSITKILTRGIREGQIDASVNAEAIGMMIYTSIQGAIVLSKVEGDGQSYGVVKKYLHSLIDSITV